MRKRNQQSFTALFESEKQRILNDPRSIEQIYEKLDRRMEVIKPKKHA
ncbi:FbpB family small basic protein [Halalkalibacillus sediminis]|uniref:FbpB family small basic protein n=1 Tax=Halalkalibacillus sediminis TaxID=2018042 RepID=A0A2I0QWN5_9BACI|nr:FbpB family small basic protein [Halalkalibacillus sediminis]PKR78728.1 FbpB family small basic protein [Halalkalibacillus sediminis]